MTGETDPRGLAARLQGAERLQAVLKGAPFVPFASEEIPDGRDRAFANRLVTTALRRHGHLDAIAARLLTRGMPPRSGSFEAVLRLGLTELLFMPEQPAHSAIFLAAEALKRDRRARHLVKLVNGVLRRAQREAADFTELPQEKLFPAWLATRWRQAYGAAAFDAFSSALLDGAVLDLTLSGDGSAPIAGLDAERLMADSYRVGVRDRAVADLPGFAEGAFFVQDFAAALPARLLGLAPGARVLDVCAAPGGKTAQLAKYGYRVTALDKDAARMQRVTDNLKRLKLQAETIVADALDFEPDAPFDGVLVDAPCSATGTFRRHPEVIWHRSTRDIAARVALQRRILTRAAGWVRPGGILIYCVCSLEPEEGETQSDWVVRNLPDFKIVPVTAAEVGGLGASLDDKGRVRTHPGLAVPGELGGAMDGFHVARFTRARVQQG